MDILDWFNFVAYIVFVWNVWSNDESYAYLYNRAVIALRDVA